MIGLDTNVLVRVLVDDGSPDVAKARGFVAAQAAAGHELRLDAVVLAETAWVLETVFGYGRTDIARAIEALLGNAAYAVDGRDAAHSALERFRASKADFSDCLILARNEAAGCAGTATLDKAMQRLTGVVPVR